MNKAFTENLKLNTMFAKYSKYCAQVAILLLIWLALGLTDTGIFGDMWLLRWGMVAAFCVVQIFPLESPYRSLQLTSAYLIIRGLVSVYSSRVYSPELHPAAVEAIRGSAAEATLAFTLCALAVTSIRVRTLWTARWIVGELSSLLAIAILLSGNSWRVPLFDNPSMGASLVALTLPYALGNSLKSQWISIGLAAAVVVQTRALAPALVFGVVVIAMYRNWVMTAIMGVGAALVVKFFPLGSSGRVAVWSRALEHWRESGPLTHLFGYGAGSFAIANPIWWRAEGGGWLYMHNDWFQILIEFGVVGLALAGYAFARLAIVADDDDVARRSALAVVIGFAALMCINPALHWPIHVLVFIVAVTDLLISQKSLDIA